MTLLPDSSPAALPGLLADPPVVVLIVLVLCTAGWIALRGRETAVACCGVVALTGAGVIAPEQLPGAFVNGLTLLLLAAYIASGLLRSSGLAARAIGRAMRGVDHFAALTRRLVWLILATAFVVPSTTGRAVLLLPVFLALAAAMPSRRHAAALALLFPTTILLSACAALTGAGAHLVAVDFIAMQGGRTVSWFDWLLFGLPFAATSCLVAERLILTVALSPGERSRGVALEWAAQTVAASERTASDRAAAVRAALRGIDWSVLLLVGCAIAIAEAVALSGFVDWLAARLPALLPAVAASDRRFLVAAAVLIALLSHLLVPSRTARVTVLLPSLALPIVALGADPVAPVLMLTMASGFCQLSPAGAKAMPIFGMLADPADVRRLGWLLLPPMFFIALGFAWFVWPLLGLRP
ncbi:MAG: SLC13 family permease [Lautropia sp.]